MAFKINTDKVKNTSIGKFSKTMKISIALGVVVVSVLTANFFSTYNLKKTVEVVKLETAVPQDGRILKDNMVKDSMSYSEYEKQGVYTLSDGTQKRSIILWEDRERVTDAYASYYIRQDTPLYWDGLSKETTKSYSYLYKMDGELLKLELDADEFGTMLVPGDKINVRASYNENEYVLPNESEFTMQQEMGISAEKSVNKNIMLFNSVVVLDILNNKGDSIFDIYYKLLAMPKTQQLNTLASEDFQEQVEPKEILLNVTPEEATKYMDVSNKSAKYLMTLMPRTSGNLITEALNDLQIGFQRDQEK